jgi:hypothetical protein
MGNFLKKVLPYAAGALGGSVANMFSATKPYAAAISAGAGALTNSKNRVGGALQGFAGGGLGAAATGALKSGSAGYGAGNGAWEGLKQFGGTIPGFGGIGTSNPTGAMAKFFSPKQTSFGAAPSSVPTSSTPNQDAMMKFKAGMYGNQSPMFDSSTKFTLPTSSTAPAGNVATGGSGSSIGDTFKKFGGGMMDYLPGTGVMMAGNLLSPSVSEPDFAGATAALRNAAAQPTSDPDATAFYKETLSPNSFVDSEPGLAVDKRVHDQQLADTLRAFDLQTTAAMGGQNPSNNSEIQKQRADIIDRANASWTANQSQFQFQYDQARKTQQMQAATALSGMATEQRNMILQLAQLDIGAIMYKTGLDAAEAASFKDMFSAVGTNMMTNATNASDPYRQKSLAAFDKILGS